MEGLPARVALRFLRAKRPLQVPLYDQMRYARPVEPSTLEFEQDTARYVAQLADKLHELER